MRALQPSLLWILGQIFSFSGNSAAPRGLENSSVLLIGIPGCTWIFHRTKYGYFCHQIANVSIFGHKSGHGGADLPVKSTLWTMTVEEQMCWKLLSLIFLSLGKKRGMQWYLEQILLAVGLEKKGIWGFSCCDADWLEVTVLSMYKGVTSYTAECFQALSPGSEGNNSITKHQWVALGDEAVMAWLWEPNFWPEFSSPLHLNITGKIRYTHLSSVRCMRMWPNLWANFRQADFRYPHHLMGLERCPADCSALCEIRASSQLLPGFPCDSQGNTSLFCACAEGGSAGPPGEAAVGRDY